MSIGEQRLFEDRRQRVPLDVVGLGESSLDHLCVVESWPVAGEKLALIDYDVCSGGQVASALLGCARLGLRASYIGAVGGDAAAETVLHPLLRAGVDLAGVRRIPGARTRTATILVRQGDGERTVLAHRDSRLVLVPAQLETREIERARLLHLDAGDPDAALWAARTANQAGIPVVLDADHLWPDPERLLSVTDFPVVSRNFAEEWGGTGDPADGLARLAGLGARLAVVTCGAEGAMAGADQQRLDSPAFDIEVADTTGAGDAFHAGFIWALLDGRNAASVLRVANAVAGLACKALGAQEGLPRRGELEAFLAAHTETVDGRGASSVSMKAQRRAADPPRDRRRSGAVVTQLLALLIVLVGAGGFNYYRNLQAEVRDARPRPFESYTSKDLEALRAAYAAEIDTFEQRYERQDSRRRRASGSGLMDERVREFEQIQQTSGRLRELRADVADREARVRELDAELRAREARLSGLKLHLERLLTI